MFTKMLDILELENRKLDNSGNAVCSTSLGWPSRLSHKSNLSFTEKLKSGEEFVLSNLHFKQDHTGSFKLAFYGTQNQHNSALLFITSSSRNRNKPKRHI